MSTAGLVLDLLHARKVSLMCYRTISSISSLSGLHFVSSVRKSAEPAAGELKPTPTNYKKE